VRVTISEKLPVSLNFDNHTVEAGTENFLVPVRCSVTGPLPSLLKDLSFEMEFNSTLFQPVFVSKGNFTIIPRGGKTFLRVEAGDVVINQSGQELLSITAKILAGDSAVMPLVFEKVEVAEGCVEVAARYGGALTVTGCSLEARQADFSDAISMNIAPNPAADEAEISIVAFESGEHTVRIFDVRGKVIWQESFKNDGISVVKKLHVNLASFAEGTYQAVLSTPTISRTLVLQIVR